jgi:hypothetical protein
VCRAREQLKAGKGCVSVFLGLAGWGQQATAGSAASGPASCCASSWGGGGQHGELVRRRRSVRCRVGPLCWDRCFYRFPTHPRFTPEQLAEWVRNFLYIFMFSLFFRNKLQFEKIVETILLPVINCCQEIGLAVRCAAYVIKWRKLQTHFCLHCVYARELWTSVSVWTGAKFKILISACKNMKCSCGCGPCVAELRVVFLNMCHSCSTVEFRGAS